MAKMRIGFVIAALVACGLVILVSPPAWTQSSAPPVKIGWLVALTGPNSTPGIGFDRGIKFAAEQINKAGGARNLADQCKLSSTGRHRDNIAGAVND